MPDHDNTFVLKASVGQVNETDCLGEPTLTETSPSPLGATGETASESGGTTSKPNGFECVLAARDTEEMKQWLSDIHSCISPGFCSSVWDGSNEKRYVK
jgi:hypothetical protein